MIEYVTRHFWERASPNQNPPLWILHQVLRLPKLEGLSIATVVYGANQYFELVDHEYYDKWNSYRADLVAHYVDPPAGRVPDIPIQLRRPIEADPCQWILTIVMGFTLNELKVFRGLNRGLPQYRQDIPLLRSSCLALYRMKLKDELLSGYHRSRYLLGKYYLEYIYHERLIKIQRAGRRRR